MTSEAALPCSGGREGAATQGRRCLGTGEQGSSLAGCNKALPAPSLNHGSAGSEHSACASDHPVQMISHGSAPPAPLLPPLSLSPALLGIGQNSPCRV